MPGIPTVSALYPLLASTTIENCRLIALLNNSSRSCLDGCCLVRRLLFLKYGRPRGRLRHLMHGVGGGVDVGPTSFFLGVCPSPLFHLCCTCRVCLAFGVPQSSMLSSQSLLSLRFMVRKVCQMFHRHQVVLCYLPTRDTLA